MKRGDLAAEIAKVCAYSLPPRFCPPTFAPTSLMAVYGLFDTLGKSITQFFRSFWAAYKRKEQLLT